jgi:GT2 family glycosyltransferase
MSDLQVTIVVVPRERFSFTEESLESIYKQTNFPFKLVYVDGNSPSNIKRYLETQAQQKGFDLIRTEYFLSPNQARNLGLSHVDTKYAVFIDNDVLVKPGWLEALVRCAEETKAAVVGPLCLEGRDFQTIHMVGGTSEFREKGNRRWLVEKRPFMKQPLAKIESKLQRQTTELLELHCAMACTETLKQIGQFDENLMSMGEESDFCMSFIQAGKSIYFEPDSMISYVPPPPLTWSDLPFFFVRWSRAWCKVSVNHFRDKWNLTDDSPTLRHYEEFVDRHRAIAFIQARKEGSYLLSQGLYWLKRIVLYPMNKAMDWRASQLFSGSSPKFRNS